MPESRRPTRPAGNGRSAGRARPRPRCKQVATVYAPDSGGAEPHGPPFRPWQPRHHGFALGPAADWFTVRTALSIAVPAGCATSDRIRRRRPAESVWRKRSDATPTHVDAVYGAASESARGTPRRFQPVMLTAHSATPIQATLRACSFIRQRPDRPDAPDGGSHRRRGFPRPWSACSTAAGRAPR